MTREGLRSGAGRRELKHRGRGIKDRVDKSMGIVTLIAEVLGKSRPTEPLRLGSELLPKRSWAIRRSRTNVTGPAAFARYPTTSTSPQCWPRLLTTCCVLASEKGH